MTQYISSFFKNFFAPKVPMPLWLKILIGSLSLAALVLLIIMILILRKKARQRIGITNRKCPVCKRKMKDDWDECVFCKYLPKKKKKNKKKEEIEE